MVGWAQRVKDPLWTLDVLSQLRATDPRWRLLLIGRDFNSRAHAGAMAYRDEFRERAAADDVRDGLVYVGYTTDLPEALRDAGFVISASRREGFPVGPTEGAASGAVPIMRDWPMYASYEGARGVFPAPWVVQRPEEAVERILAFADPERRDEEGAAARRHVVASFDWSVVEPHSAPFFSASERHPASTSAALSSSHLGHRYVVPPPPSRRGAVAPPRE